MSEHIDKNVQRGKRAARRAGDEAADWAEPMARVGYAAKGFVYIAAGVLSAMAAFGYGGKTTGSKGALASLANEPFGQFLMIVLAVGLFAYAGWAMIQAFVDPEAEGTDAKALAKRGAKFISGLIYGGLGVYAARLSQGTASGSGGQGKATTWSAKVMQWPGGEWMVGAAGGIIGIYGLVQAWRGKELKFLESLDESEISPKERRGIKILGQVGLWARAVVFLMIGAFLIVAAVQHNPQQAMGLQETLATLLQQPYGSWLMGAVALGLAAYGVFCFAKARYRVIRT
ncbi:DUF1206 domain-containing protein [Persicimonas caeni]|uniref:DUF1206 domain-containing protein n=1 Tax=Persicimonas caeni TaxID=2292766 RepID=A0A4Y6PPN8_PERCE|nr:DUF1206 domain-containing protein [Persicimonas caeni]QDG50306.1 DUF1206 domain-containing protein [Persicimonas caeni]QED31527.1 DUF1206 domain-containing protein [Persicimonas caeni]